MKTQPFASRARSGIVLIVFCAVVFAVPAFIGRALPEANTIDPAPRDTLKSKSPDYVFIGNSMVETRIDVTTLENLTKGRVALLAEVPLVLIRVKRRPEPDGITGESAKLREYVEALKDYLNMREVPFYDETPDCDIPETWYADGDHIAPEYRAEYTEHFYHELERFFE